MRVPTNNPKPFALPGLATAAPGFRDPYKELAEQKARKLVGPGLAQPATSVPPPGPAALLDDVARRPARFYYELGLTAAATGEMRLAMEALRRAVALKPGLGAAWRKLGEMLLKAGDLPGHADALAAAARATSDDADTIRARKIPPGKIERDEAAWVARLEANPASSGETLRAHLRNDPTDVAALRALGHIGQAKGLHDAAQMIFERALELAPQFSPVRADYVRILLLRGRPRAALPHAERLAADEPAVVRYRVLLATCLADLGAYDRALAVFRTVQDVVQRDADLLVKYSYVLRYTGQRDGSLKACRDCIAMAPGSGKAWWSLADMKNEKFTEADLDAMRAQLAQGGLPAEERAHMHYALGAALERAGAYDESFAQYASGAAIMNAETPYHSAEFVKEMARSTCYFTAPRLADSVHGHKDPAPIFILGLPRVGSTLIEQILASHSTVEGTQELTEMTDIAYDVGKAFGLGPHSLYPERLASLSPAEIAELGARYIETTRIYRQTNRPHFIDKMPGNWMYVGLIHTILPNAKIIDARREPMASGFAVFKQLFGGGLEYSYDLRNIGLHYRLYVETMAHFDAVLPGRVHRVVYENMVNDTEAEIRKLLDYCGLAFEPGCLRFWETQRAVATPSAEQVRRPISRAALEQWRNYEKFLAPLREVVG